MEYFSSLLNQQADSVKAGDLSSVEAQLLAQMQTLNSIFQNYTARAFDLPLHRGGELYLRLALKAQIQATRTAEVLGNLKNAPVILANQLNMAQNQQVNNNPAANSELAKESKHARRKPYRLDARAPQAPLTTLDARATSRASRTHPADSAVENPRPAENTGSD